MKLKTVLAILSLTMAITACGTTQNSKEIEPSTESVVTSEVEEPPSVEVEEPQSIETTSDNETYLGILDKTIEKLKTDEYVINMNWESVNNSGQETIVSLVYTDANGINNYNKVVVDVDGNVRTEPIVYMAEVEGVLKGARLANDTEWAEVENPEDYLHLTKILSGVTVKQQYDVTGEFEFYSIEANGSNILSELPNELFQGHISINSSTGLVNSLSFDIPDFDDHNNNLMNINFDFQNNVSACPPGFEEFVGYTPEEFNIADTDNAIASAKEAYEKAEYKSVIYDFTAMDASGVTDVYTSIGRFQDDFSDWSANWDSFNGIDEIGKNAGETDRHLAKHLDDGVQCLVLDGDTLEFSKCTGDCDTLHLKDFFDSVQIGEYQSSIGQYAQFSGKVNSSEFPHISKYIDEQELDCIITMVAGENTISRVEVVLNNVEAKDGKTYEEMRFSVSFVYSSENLEVHPNFEEALKLYE